MDKLTRIFEEVNESLSELGTAQEVEEVITELIKNRGMAVLKPILKILIVKWGTPDILCTLSSIYRDEATETKDDPEVNDQALQDIAGCLWTTAGGVTILETS